MVNKCGEEGCKSNPVCMDGTMSVQVQNCEWVMLCRCRPHVFVGDWHGRQCVAMEGNSLAIERPKSSCANEQLNQRNVIICLAWGVHGVAGGAGSQWMGGARAHTTILLCFLHARLHCCDTQVRNAHYVGSFNFDKKALEGELVSFSGHPAPPYGVRVRAYVCAQCVCCVRVAAASSMPRALC